jgi:hypothetical protein
MGHAHRPAFKAGLCSRASSTFPQAIVPAFHWARPVIASYKLIQKAGGTDTPEITGARQIAAEAMATTTMDFMIREPKHAAHHREEGFEVLRKAII